MTTESRPANTVAPRPLLELLNLPMVARPEAVHLWTCRFWRNGKAHGPCACGAEQINEEIRARLALDGVMP